MILFFGSFNPLTKAHLKIAHKVNAIFNEEVVFIPVSDGYKKETLIMPFDYRYGMIEATIRDHSGLKVDDIEERIFKKTKRQMKTIETLSYFDKPKLLLGEDNFKNLKNWYRGKDIIDNYKLIVYKRSDDDIQGSDKVFIIEDDIIDMSSTKARKALKEGKGENFLDLKTYEYLLRNDLLHYYK